MSVYGTELGGPSSLDAPLHTFALGGGGRTWSERMPRAGPFVIHQRSVPRPTPEPARRRGKRRALGRAPSACTLFFPPVPPSARAEGDRRLWWAEWADHARGRRGEECLHVFRDRRAGPLRRYPRPRPFFCAVAPLSEWYFRARFNRRGNTSPEKYRTWETYLKES